MFQPTWPSSGKTNTVFNTRRSHKTYYTSKGNKKSLVIDGSFHHTSCNITTECLK